MGCVGVFHRTVTVNLILDLIDLNSSEKDNDKEVLMEVISKCEQPAMILSFLNNVNERKMSENFKFTPEEIKTLQTRFEDENPAIKERFRATFAGQKASESFYVEIVDAPPMHKEKIPLNVFKEAHNLLSKRDNNEGYKNCTPMITSKNQLIIFLRPNKNGINNIASLHEYARDLKMQMLALGNESKPLVTPKLQFLGNNRQASHRGSPLQEQILNILAPIQERYHSGEDQEQVIKQIDEIIKNDSNATVDIIINNLWDLSQSALIKSSSKKVLLIEEVINAISNMPLESTKRLS